MMRYGRNAGSMFGGMGMIFGTLFQIAFRVIIVRIIVTLIQNSGKLFKDNKNNEAINILKKKYANGDISKKEYLEKKKDLL